MSDEEAVEDHVGEGFGAGGFGTGLQHYESAGQAWFHFFFSFLVAAVGAFALVKMFQYRDVLEIRARSANLVMILGVCLLVDLGLDWYGECERLFGWSSSVIVTHVIYFFTIFTIESCYIWRVIRLGVSFSPRVKKAIPWVMSEKLAVMCCIAIGVVSTSIPIYYMVATDGGDDLARFILLELDVVWKCHVVLISIQMCLLPVVWMVDDIFKISWELCAAAILGVIDIVIIRLSETTVVTPGVKEYVNSRNIGILWTAVLLGLSVIDPVRRVISSPLARPASPSGSRQMSWSKKLHYSYWGSKAGNSVCGTELSLGGMDSDNDYRSGSDTARAPSSTTPSSTGTRWSYEKIASVPAVAAAFRAFAARALCQESVMFLEEVAKYEKGDFSVATPTMNDFAAFNAIVERFVAEGALDEINLG